MPTRRPAKRSSTYTDHPAPAPAVTPNRTSTLATAHTISIQAVAVRLAATLPPGKRNK